MSNAAFSHRWQRAGKLDGAQNGASFRNSTLLHLDDLYNFACILLQTQAEAEDAVYACYCQAQRTFPDRRDGAVKVWLLQILRTICRAKLAQSSGYATSGSVSRDEAAPGAAVRARIATLLVPLREVIALREFNDLQYREIAEVTGVSVETVMTRLAQARALIAATSNRSRPS